MAPTHKPIPEDSTNPFLEHPTTHESTPEDLQDPFLKHFATQVVEYGHGSGCIFLLWMPLSLSRSKIYAVMKAMDAPFVLGDQNLAEDEVLQVL